MENTAFTVFNIQRDPAQEIVDEVSRVVNASPSYKTYFEVGNFEKTKYDAQDLLEACKRLRKEFWCTWITVENEDTTITFNKTYHYEIVASRSKNPIVGFYSVHLYHL